jgi:gamma-glutamylcyclotransferase (GGCT)/AIG2-like uncharacterized protein YtfP
VSQIIVYGSLRAGQQANRALRDCAYVDTVRVPGYDLYALTWFPGIKENPDNKEGFVGELYEGVTDDLLKQLDRYEGYNREDVERSLFRREEVEVGGKPAIVYVFNKNPYEAFGTSARVVRDGDWVKYKGEVQ